MGKKKKKSKKKEEAAFHEGVVSRSRQREDSRAKAKLSARIKEVQAQEGYDPYSRQVDSTDRLLQNEIKEVETMLRFLRSYEGEQPMLLRFKNELDRHAGWVPTRRQRVLFFSIVQSRGAKGNLRTMGKADYVRALDSDGFEDEPDQDDGPTSLDP